MKYMTTLLVLLFFTQLTLAQDRPPNAEPGKCYAKGLISDTNLDDSMVWSEVLCGDKITPGFIRKLQQALLVKGLLSEKPDGKFSPPTKAALSKFQKENGLPIGNLDYKTLQTLGIKP